jgi:hypothetical protein
MRLLFLAATVAFFCSARPANAQRADTQPPTASNSSERTAPVPRSGRLACVPLVGKVYDPNGNPLVGATLLVKGTHDIYVTDSEGKFLLANTVYEGQQLTVGAAGYIPQDVPLTDCTLPRLVLEKDPTAHIKRSGKRVGQVTRLNNRRTNLK